MLLFFKKNAVYIFLLNLFYNVVQEECDIQSMKIFKEFNRRRGISDKVRRVEETSSNISSSHAAKRGEEAQRLEARDLDSLLGRVSLKYGVELFFLRWSLSHKR